MTDLVFYDASTPPATPPNADGVAFYIGGDTPHVWTPAEINATRARYRLPIFVRSNPAAASAAVDATVALEALHKIGAPAGTLVSWDTETAADPGYMATVYRLITGAGYHLIDYGSQDNLFGNDMPPGGYYWGADWTGNQAVLAGDAGTQYATGPWDLSVFKAGLPFWDTHAHAGPPPPTPAPLRSLPTIGQGATGELVKSIQALCGARGVPVMVDGIFGIDTATAVELVQRHGAIPADGIVGLQTWPVLLGIA
jgi:peptidoglycan hydrolase-like protein with peptidoglycan-binding domain